jgi:hypothetical protein
MESHYDMLFCVQAFGFRVLRKGKLQWTWTSGGVWIQILFLQSKHLLLRFLFRFADRHRPVTKWDISFNSPHFYEKVLNFLVKVFTRIGRVWMVVWDEFLAWWCLISDAWG